MFDYRPEISEEDYEYNLQCDDDYERWLDEMEEMSREEYLRDLYDN